MRALIADDEPSAQRLAALIKPHNLNAEVAQSGEEALEFAKLYDFDIAILGSGLADMDAPEAVRALRAAGVTTPALILAATNDKEAKIRALICGADDYLLKPIDPDELAARVQAIVRRARGHAASVIRTGRLTIDLSSRTVEIDGKPLKVSPKEYGILELLSLRKGRTLSKEAFLDHLYGGMDEPEQKIIDVFVCKLRKKIASLTGDDGGIETVWGYGYTLKDAPAGTVGVAEEGAGFLFEGDLERRRELEFDLLLLQLLPDEPAPRSFSRPA